MAKAATWMGYSGAVVPATFGFEDGELLSGTTPASSWWYSRREGATVVENGSHFGFELSNEATQRTASHGAALASRGLRRWRRGFSTAGRRCKVRWPWQEAEQQPW
ncbi:hypothetical protein PIB30_006228 [Stylosanthes scabra]|uniref:Uncharacterized protein n=1 Tax=Stylosanthes scabra TaxID=79078 RepID=A0ABU6Z4X7_9FABA|nr:hypothetical protein [Stylosanthes scabra]